MKRWQRWAIYGAVGLAMLLAALLGVIRTLRHHSQTPVRVTAEVMRARNFITDVYAARAGDRVLLFDAGVDGEGQAFDALLAAVNARRDQVTDVYLTHGHFDHVAAAGRFSRARIHIGAGDVDLLAQREAAGRGAVRLLQALMPVEAASATRPLSGVVEDTPPGVLALPTPGHTPGSYVFYFGGVLFTGDTIQIEGDHLVVAAAPFTLDATANRRSISGLGAALQGRPLAFICAGHSGCTPPGRAQVLLDELIARTTP